MQDFLVLVMSDPVDGREADYHDWYDRIHLDEVIATAGFRTAQRFVLGAQQGSGAKHRYLALYETEGESADEVLERLGSTRPARIQTDAIDVPGAGVWVFTPIGPRHEATDDG